MTDNSLSISPLLPANAPLASKFNHELIQLLPVGVYLCDASGYLVAFNRKAAEIWGQTPDFSAAPVKFSGAFRLLSTDGLHIPHDQSPLAAILLTQKAVMDFRILVERRDGSVVPVLTNLIPLFDDDRAMVGYMVSVQDLRQQAVEELAKDTLQSALFQSQKMELVGQLTSGLTNDFQNQLASLSMSLGLMGSEIDKLESERLSKYHEVCQASLDRATALAENLLLFSRQRPRRIERIDPNQMLIGMASLIRSNLGSKIIVELELGTDAAFLRANRQQLESAILNLAFNARDAMPTGGRLTLSTRNASLDRNNFPDHNANFRPGRYVQISVADTGGGLTEETLQNIFTPFFTTKEAGKGNGLGLTMVRGFVTDMNGQLAVESEAGNGARFHLYFPSYGTEQSLAISGDDHSAG